MPGVVFRLGKMGGLGGRNRKVMYTKPPPLFLKDSRQPSTLAHEVLSYVAFVLFSRSITKYISNSRRGVYFFS